MIIINNSYKALMHMNLHKIPIFMVLPKKLAGGMFFDTIQKKSTARDL